MEFHYIYYQANIVHFFFISSFSFGYHNHKYKRLILKGIMDILRITRTIL